LRIGKKGGFSPSSIPKKRRIRKGLYYGIQDSNFASKKKKKKKNPKKKEETKSSSTGLRKREEYLRGGKNNSKGMWGRTRYSRGGGIGGRQRRYVNRV